MRFALLGNHPDGLAMAEALVGTGRHTLIVKCDVNAPAFAPRAKSYQDTEEVLADPEVELVIVAGPMTVRAEQLRRAIQSERDVLCVHPCAERPDAAYEAALIQGDTKRLLMPLLPDVLHPAVERLREELRSDAGLRLLTVGQQGPSVGQPPWDVLRGIGGELIEVSGFAESEEIDGAKPLVWSGRFETGGLVSGLSWPAEGEWTTVMAIGSPKTERLTKQSERWTRLANAVEAARENPEAAVPSWQDEVRSLELQDALRRSVEKRRTSSLEYQEISEEVGNKGTLTLIGCGMIWFMLLIFGLSIWWAPIRWAIVPMLIGYLALLAINWLAKK